VAGKQDGAIAFLSADVGVQTNGMTLSVISMLSRQDIDPLEEVKYLSSLHRGEAVARLTTVILSASTDLPRLYRASVLASDLISLLPAFRAGAFSSGKPSCGAQPSDDLNPFRSSTWKVNYTRLLLAFIACGILLDISLVDQRPAASSAASTVSTGVATAPAPAVLNRAHLVTH
jgi:hypothetical protein